MHGKTLGAQDFLKRAASVASYYGFSPFEPTLRSEQRHAKQNIPPARDCLSEEMREMFSTLPHSIAKSSNAFQFYHTSTREPRSKKQPIINRFGLTVLGIERSVAEAFVLRSTLAILGELGIHDIHVEVNSIGDRDSMQRFLRELSTYLRKHLADLPAPCREALKRDAFEALALLVEKDHPLATQAPRPMQYLTDASRRHLKEIIEFLELSNIPYEINTDLIGSLDYYSQTIFEIKENIDEEAHAESPHVRTGIRARGGRCDEFTKKLLRTKLPVVSVVIEQPLLKRESVAWKPPRVRHPKVYFIHLGPRAKLISLSMLETLRKAHIPLRQAIGNDSLTEQLEEARDLGIPQALIIGQREALDGTIIVRDMQTHAQTTIPLPDLPGHLKSLGL